MVNILQGTFVRFVGYSQPIRVSILITLLVAPSFSRGFVARYQSAQLNSAARSPSSAVPWQLQDVRASFLSEITGMMQGNTTVTREAQQGAILEVSATFISRAKEVALPNINGPDVLITSTAEQRTAEIIPISAVTVKRGTFTTTPIAIGARAANSTVCRNYRFLDGPNTITQVASSTDGVVKFSNRTIPAALTFEDSVSFCLVFPVPTTNLQELEFAFGGSQFTLAPASLNVPLKPTSQEPVLISMREADYSEEARRARVQGTVELLVTVTHDGSVEVKSVIKSLGYGLDEKAKEAAKAWKFRPAMKDGQPVSADVSILINFSLRSSDLQR